MTRLEEINAELNKLIEETKKYPWHSFDDPLFKEDNVEWNRLNKLHEKAMNKFFSYWKKHRKEIDYLTIEENKKNHVYWDREDWIYDAVSNIQQHFELTGQERTREFVKDLEKLHGCVVTEEDAGYTLEIFTPYKVYIYRFNRGYGDYPITIKKGFIAPYGNVYNNKIFLAKSARDMKEHYHDADN